MKYIIAIIGKAGAGKDTIQDMLCQQHKEYHKIVSCTTRPKRENEIEGINYYYLNNEEFAQKVINGDMLEATYFNGWHYGTSKNSLVDGINIGVFNPGGYDCLIQMPEDEVKLIGFYIIASDKTRMLRQLNREQFPDVHEIVRRFQADEEDFEDLETAPAINVIINDNQNIQDVVDEINTIIQDLVHFD